MRNKNISIYHKAFFSILICSIVFSSCKKFVELGPPPTQTVQADVFTTDATATSAVLGLYSSGWTNLFVGFTFYPGMMADDIKFSSTDPTYNEFNNDAISITNSYNNNLWYYAYQQMKNINYAIVGLTNSTTLTPSVKAQLLGEAKFLRAYVYFYMVNIYGDVPLLTSDDALANATVARTPAAQVWAQIIADLKDAKTNLSATYKGTFRARVNSLGASALLARAYLYTKDYVNAEAEATVVISSGTYSLQTSATAFINTSNEIIWQVANTTGVSTFGANFLAATGSIPTYIMYDTLYNSFEAGDLRKTNWTGSTLVGTTTYYYVNKYKVRTGTGNEYNVCLRFAELYLIRAEARAQQNKLSDAKDDLDMIRVRAGLGVLSTGLTQTQTLLAVEQERKAELFGEWGHRWFDLVRTNRATAVIGGLKPATWQATDVLFPIPDQQRLANTNLTQNPGY
ncbi:MAG: RagB/SusD family nutrient uptake outer membrane protein [Ferruginibacter sp.]